jgi:hypothetical protein
MGTWLDRWSWDAWCTLTFRDGNFSSEAATRAWDNFVAWLELEQPRLGFFVGHEVGARGRLHLHALLGGLEPYTQRSALHRWWLKRYGRAQVLAFVPSLGAAHYVSKYVAKDLAHFDLNMGRMQWQSEQLSHLLRPDSPSWKRQRGERA